MNKKELNAIKDALHSNNIPIAQLAEEFYNRKSFMAYIYYYLHGQHLTIEDNAKKYLKLKSVNPRTLYKYRKEHGLTQKALGTKLHVDQRVISFYELGYHIDIENKLKDNYIES